MDKNIIKNLQLFDKYYRQSTFGRKNNIKFTLRQLGGGSLKFKYQEKIIKFKKYQDENIELYLKTIDKKDNCLVITIIDNIGYISTINSSFGKCLEDKELTNNGSTYTKIAISLLRKYKTEFKINKIQLSDDAVFYCDKQTSLSMSKLNFLQHGESFYGRFGFLPCDNNDKEHYHSNKLKINKIKTNHINLKKILLKYKGTINTDLLNIINHKFSKYQNHLFTKWFNKISRILSKENCSLLKFLIDELFIELKLYPIDNIFYEMIL